MQLLLLIMNYTTEQTYTVYARRSGDELWTEYKKGITAKHVLDAIKYYMLCDEQKNEKWDYKIVPK